MPTIIPTVTRIPLMHGFPPHNFRVKGYSHKSIYGFTSHYLHLILCLNVIVSRLVAFALSFIKCCSFLADSRCQKVRKHSCRQHIAIIRCPLLIIQELRIVMSETADLVESFPYTM